MQSLQESSLTPSVQPTVVGIPSQYSSLVFPAEQAKHSAVMAMQHTGSSVPLGFSLTVQSSALSCVVPTNQTALQPPQ
jgi:hypothetical protein